MALLPPPTSFPRRTRIFDACVSILGGFGLSFAIFFLGVILQSDFLRASLSGMGEKETQTVVLTTTVLTWWVWWLIVSIGGLFFSWVLYWLRSGLRK